MGDPSAVASGEYPLPVCGRDHGCRRLQQKQAMIRVPDGRGQCISVARIALKDLDHPASKADSWDEKGIQHQPRRYRQALALSEDPDGSR